MMPAALQGGGWRLPHWARAVAGFLPRTAAAMLRLDHAHRARSPVDARLRAKMRYVVAQANQCGYFMAHAAADLSRSGAPRTEIDRLAKGPEAWGPQERDDLELARGLTLAAPHVPDPLFARLRDRHGDGAVAAMVLLAAYGNFQDRMALGLGLPLEQEGIPEPRDVTFADDAFQLVPISPAHQALFGGAGAGGTPVPQDPEWSGITYEQLQERLEAQRSRVPRLPIPTWEMVRPKLPAAMAARPTRIVWNLVCAGYAPELAIPWSITTRTMWAETEPDRVFEESLFWVQTRALGCNYCMGHCEMLLEVAGLDKQAVAERTRRLASSDWSTFAPPEQRAYAYARKLSAAPWTLTAADYAQLQADLGSRAAFATFWWLCRGLYMTRVSDGFQLPLERDNVFNDFYKPPA
jgi:alkylhydroperoxidase family enzyme